LNHLLKNETHKPMKTKTSSLFAALMLVVTLILAGCSNTGTGTVPPGMDKPHVESVILHEGDVVRVSFPGTPTLDAVQQIRRDGKITLKLVDDVQAAGLTPDDLQKKLVDLYESQISTKQIVVLDFLGVCERAGGASGQGGGGPSVDGAGGHHGGGRL
jgi:protein involved in polysaccharide export with SLBB domain